MPKQDTLPELDSAPSPNSSSISENEETGVTAALKIILWFLVLPIAVVLLIKWLMGI